MFKNPDHHLRAIQCFRCGVVEIEIEWHPVLYQRLHRLSYSEGVHRARCFSCVDAVRAIVAQVLLWRFEYDLLFYCRRMSQLYALGISDDYSAMRRCGVCHLERERPGQGPYGYRLPRISYAEEDVARLERRCVGLNVCRAVQPDDAYPYNEEQKDEGASTSNDAEVTSFLFIHFVKLLFCEHFDAANACAEHAGKDVEPATPSR